jgi:hypothetical protein
MGMSIGDSYGLPRTGNRLVVLRRRPASHHPSCRARIRRTTGEQGTTNLGGTNTLVVGQSQRRSGRTQLTYLLLIISWFRPGRWCTDSVFFFLSHSSNIEKEHLKRVVRYMFRSDRSLTPKSSTSSKSMF